MGKMGYGYGSEWHLLRWMGRHREAFDKHVLDAIGRSGCTIDWLDFNFDPNIRGADNELKGLEFLGTNKQLQKEWNKFWPTGSGIHNWDAVGWVRSVQGRELLLVEAKAHVGETKTDCQAKDRDSIKRIKGAFGIVKNALGVPSEIDWMKDYYQGANRIAALHFLHQQKIPSHLVFICFIGDLCGSGRNSPQSKPEWQKALDDQDGHIGLPKGHLLENWIHKLFLKIDSDEQEEG